MAYDNRGDFFYGVIKTAMDTLSTYDSDVTIVDAPSRRYPNVMFFIEDEHYTYEEDEARMMSKANGLATLHIYVTFKTTNKKNSEDDLRELSNDWADWVENALRSVDLKQSYMHTISGVNKYRITIRKILINDVIKALAAENDQVGILYVNGTLEFDKSFILT